MTNTSFFAKSLPSPSRAVELEALIETVQQIADEAQTQTEEAVQQALAAQTSAVAAQTAIAGSVEEAAGHASDASDSATSADTSKSLAASSATSASGSASAASTSATNAAGSATSANSSASAASTSATAAAGSASSAASSASAASTSATNAASSASNAAASASSAAANAAAVVAAIDGADLDAFLRKDGGTMVGALTLSGAPTSNLHPATKLYVDTGLTAGLATKQDTIGFTPVQQGGGAGQGTNKVYLGWNSGSGALHLQVDSTNLGAIAQQSWVTGQGYATSSALSAGLSTKLNVSGGGITGNLDVGGTLGVSGNINTSGSLNGAAISVSAQARASIFENPGGGAAFLRVADGGQVAFSKDGSGYPVYSFDGGAFAYLVRGANIRNLQTGDWGGIWSLIAQQNDGANVVFYSDTISSDERLKENVAPSSADALAELKALRVVSFDYNADGLYVERRPAERAHVDLGLIAQDVAQIVPDAAPIGPTQLADGTTEDRYRLRPELLVPHLIRAVQQLEARVSALESPS